MVTLDAPPSYDDARSPIDLTLATDSSGKDILITIKPPTAPTVTAPLDEKDEKEEKVELKAKRAPVDFVLTIDVSGSMATEAPVPGDNERTGLTVLDVVKHAAKTIITTMKSEDRVAIVSFTGQAKVVLPLTATDEEGKTMALKKVDELRPLDSTNLWDGLKQSMNILVGAAAADPEAPRSTVRSLVAAGNVIAAGIANIAVGTSSSEPKESNHRLASIFLLTDGLPNVEPPRGHIPMLKLYLDSQPKEKTKFTINTFGFGYTLDSKLLNDIAKIGNGHFGFIPDSGMVGTNFVHAVANTYATYAEGLYVDIEVDDDRAVKGLQVLGDFETTKASWGVQVPLGQLQYGQTRDLVIRLPASLSKSPVTVTARCRPWNSNDEIKTSRVISDSYIPAPESATDPNLLYHTFRLNFVSTAHKEVSSTPNNTSKGYVQQIDVPPNMATAFKDLASSIKAAFPGEKPAGPSAEADALDLAEDISGQVLEGIETKQSFNRWGLHYLLSLTRSHLRQQCGNFKDPGLQPYGRDSTLFKTMRDEIDTTFDNLPPPKPSSSSPRPTGASYGSLGSPGAVSSRRSMRGGMPAGAAPAPSQMAPTAQSASFSMSRYNKRSAPCFAGSSLIELSTGEKFRVDELSVGASVKTPTGGAAVIGIVRTSSTDESFHLCELGEGLLITPWHPVYVAADKQWRFPADIVPPKQLPCSAVYSLILEENDDSDAHAVYIGGIRCVTMGHGVVDPADVRVHPFLSNHASIMRVLKANPDFTKGTVNSFGAMKDSETGLMCGFVWKEDTPYAVASPSIARDLMQVEPRSITIQA